MTARRPRRNSPSGRTDLLPRTRCRHTRAGGRLLSRRRGGAVPGRDGPGTHRPPPREPQGRSTRPRRRFSPVRHSSFSVTTPPPSRRPPFKPGSRTSPHRGGPPMRASLAWTRHGFPVAAAVTFAAAIFEPAGEKLPLGAAVLEIRENGRPWEGRYVGRTESGLYVLRFGKVLVLAERSEFVRADWSTRRATAGSDRARSAPLRATPPGSGASRRRARIRCRGRSDSFRCGR